MNHPLSQLTFGLPNKQGMTRPWYISTHIHRACDDCVYGLWRRYHGRDSGKSKSNVEGSVSWKSQVTDISRNLPTLVSSTKTIAAMATDKNSNGFNFGTTTNVGGSFGNRFEGQRFAGATAGVVAAFQKQVPDFLRTDPDVVRMVAALNREENNFNRIRKEVEIKGKNKN